MVRKKLFAEVVLEVPHYVELMEVLRFVSSHPNECGSRLQHIAAALLPDCDDSVYSD